MKINGEGKRVRYDEEEEGGREREREKISLKHTKDGAAGAGHCLVGRRCLGWSNGCGYMSASS